MGGTGENENFALVPRPPSAIEKEPSAKRLLSGMVADTLALVKSREQSVTALKSDAGEELENWCKTGEKYYSGIDTPENYAEAAKWFRMAAERGHPRAQYWLGHLHANGFGIQRDYEQAVRWFHEAAKQGNAHAQSNLGLCYCHGKGVEQDYKEGVRWYQKAAAQGDTGAMQNLGCYYRDINDYIQAVGWFRKVAEKGSPIGQFELAQCYFYGRGVKQDYAEAVRLYRKAAESDCFFGWGNPTADSPDFGHGYDRAQFNLGLAYFNGRGVPIDKLEAYKWFKLAAELSHKEAAEQLTSIKSSLLPKQLQEAERRYIKFKENYKPRGYCPLCGGEVYETDSGYACKKGHTWNVSRKGKTDFKQ